MSLMISHVAHTFRHKDGPAKVIEDVSMSVEAGEFVSVVGPSGSGKTTLFHIVGGLLHPSLGGVFMDGREITGKKGLISYMPQHNTLLPWRTIEDNVILEQEVAGGSKRAARASAREWLHKVGLGGYEREFPHVLSGGMKQRVAFLRALISPRELMCLDEPFGSLDALTRVDMQRWLLRIWEENKRSVLFITHSIEEALLLSDRVYVLSQKPTTVLEEIQVPFTRPRDENVMLDPEFIHLRERVYRLMQEQKGTDRQ